MTKNEKLQFCKLLAFEAEELSDESLDNFVYVLTLMLRGVKFESVDDMIAIADARKKRA